MTDAAARTGLRAVVSGAYVPGVAEAQEVIQALSRAHPDVVHSAIAQDAPLVGEFRGSQRLVAICVPREFDFLWRGISVQGRFDPRDAGRLFLRVGCTDECMEFDLDTLLLTRQDGLKALPTLWLPSRLLMRGTSVAVEHLAGGLELMVFLHGLRWPRETT